MVKGLVGRTPKTAWVVGYPLLERIHYLLVAGFDVFGNVSHQVTTRLYMDFLRMEGESDFLMFLRPAERKELTDFWYRGVTGSAKQTVASELEGFAGAPDAAYRAGDSKADLLSVVAHRLDRVLSHAYDLERIDDPALRAALAKIDGIKGRAASLLPETSFVTVRDGRGGPRVHFTILRDSAHTNVAHLFREDARRVVAEDELTVVSGLLGAYPNALFEVSREDLPAFVVAVGALDGDAAYDALRRRFGVLRSSDRFWVFSDELNADHEKAAPLTSGLFDYNRLEAL